MSHIKSPKQKLPFLINIFEKILVYQLSNSSCRCQSVPLCLFFNKIDLDIIKSFLENSNKIFTLPNIYNNLTKNNSIDFSKKTLERHLLKLSPFVLRSEIGSINGDFSGNDTPKFYSLNNAFRINLEDITNINNLCPLLINKKAFRILDVIIDNGNEPTTKEIKDKLDFSLNLIRKFIKELKLKQILTTTRNGRKQFVQLNSLHPFFNWYSNLQKHIYYNK